MSVQTYETIKYRGFNINVYFDEDPADPRAEFDGLGTMICFHSQYRLGDVHKFVNTADAIFRILWEDLDMHTVTMDEDFQYMQSRDFVEKYWDKFEKATIVLPLYLYDHSGITMKTSPFSCGWDSGMVGFIYLSRAAAREEYGRLTSKNLLRVISYLEGEVKEYDYYLTGQVFGYQVKPTTANKSLECDDSCWGFYGETDYMVTEAKSNIDYAIKQYKEATVAHVIAERLRRLQLNWLFSNCWAY
jgi:hypothetical protein